MDSVNVDQILAHTRRHDHYTRYPVMRSYQKPVVIALALCVAVAIGGEVRLSWNQFPPAQIQPVTALQIHGSADLSVPLDQWPMLGEVPPDITNTNLQVDGTMFFYITSSNALGRFNNWDSQLRIEMKQ